jgi:hypothetical protein
MASALVSVVFSVIFYSISTALNSTHSAHAGIAGASESLGLSLLFLFNIFSAL